MILRFYLYEIQTGRLFQYDNGQHPVHLCTGYSGASYGVNSLRDIAEHRIGPIPPGSYWCGKARHHPTLGPIAIPLVPWPGNEMWGRSGFYIHGDNRRGDRSASEGCIIAQRSVRENIEAYRSPTSAAVVVACAGVIAPF